MKPRLLLAALYLCPIFLSAQQDGALEQALTAAQEQSDIFNRAERPFLLEADLTVQLATPTPGHLRIQWQSRNHWWRELEYGGYKETVVRAGEYEYAARNVGFAPLRTTQLIELLQFAKGISGFVPSKAKSRKRNGTVLSCIEGVEALSKQRSELCVDPSTHDIAGMSPWVSGVDGGEVKFSSYDGFEGMRFPKHLELRIGGSSAVSVSITKLKEQPVEANLLVPPPGAVERRYCDGMTGPAMIKHPDMSLLAFPEDARIRFQVTILKDGSVGSIQVIGQSSVEAGNRIRRAFRDAQFKPAMCGSEPVVADIVEGVDISH